MMPALWTTTEIGKRRARSAAACSVALASIRSTSTACSAGCDQSGLRRATETTSQPASIICRQIVAPIPALPPVMMATGRSLMPDPQDVLRETGSHEKLDAAQSRVAIDEIEDRKSV